MVKLKEKIKVIRLTPFPVNIWVVVTSDVINSANHAAKKIDPNAGEFEGGQAGGVTVWKHHEGNIYIIVPFNAKINVIAHEVFHAVIRAGKFVGVDDWEFEAHYVGWLTEKVHKFVQKADGK